MGEKIEAIIIMGIAVRKFTRLLRIKVQEAKLMLRQFKRSAVAMASFRSKPSQNKKGITANAAPTPAIVKIAVKQNTIIAAIKRVNIKILR